MGGAQRINRRALPRRCPSGQGHPCLIAGRMAAAGAAHARHRRERACDLPPALWRRHRAPIPRGRGGGRAGLVSRACRDRRHGARRPRTRARGGNVLPPACRRVNVSARLVSLALLIAAWYAGSQLAGERLLPDPQAVALAIVDEARSGALAVNLGATLARVAVAFVIAMALGSMIGLAMGRSRIADRLGDPWLIVLLNLPALVIIVLAYVWAGLTAIAAVALNKLPIATVTVREGARSLDRALDDMAQVFRMGPWTRMRHVILPQLAPYLAAAARSG